MLRTLLIALMLAFMPGIALAETSPQSSRHDAGFQLASDGTYRSCRRQVRRAAGIIPGKRMRLPRAYHQFIDRCVANGGVYS